MKIAHVTAYFSKEGEYEEYYLAKYQKEQGNDACIITSDIEEKVAGKKQEKHRESSFEVDGIRVYVVKTIFSKRGIVIPVGLKKLLSEIRPDIIHAHEPRLFFPVMPALWKKELKYKLITDQHEYQFPPTFLGKLFYLAVRRYVANFSFRKSDAIISITPRGKEFMIKYHHLKPDSILLFPLGADTDKLKFNPKARKKIRKKLKIKDDETLLVCLGQVIRLKKIELLLEAFSKLSKNTMLNTKVLIIGGGEEDYLQELKKRARTLNIREKMLFINRISKKEVPEYYSASDIAVWPFRATIAIQEAISCGVPIVIPNLSSMNHLVENNGFLFRQEDTSDMAEKIETLIKNKKLRKKMSENAKKLAEEKFSYRKISKSLLGLYQELLDREE